MAYVIHVWQRCHGVAPSKLHLRQTMSRAWSFSEPMHGSGSERQRCFCCMHSCPRVPPAITVGDRKSTRLNSSHSQISYAVFCLKKKKKKVQHLVYKKEKQNLAQVLVSICE